MTTNNMINTPEPFAIAAGGTGVTSVTTAPAATAWAGWDGNKNMSAFNFIAGYTTTATAAATTTLTVGSTEQQFFTGSTTQTVTLPLTSTLVLGQSFFIVNNSSGVVTVQSSGGNTIQAMGATTTLLVTCIATSGTGVASWNAIYTTEASGANFPVNTNITSMTGLTGTLQAPTGVKSSAGVDLLGFVYTASAVNYFTFTNNITTSFPIFAVTGSDASVGMAIATKNGNIDLLDSTQTIAPSLRFKNAANTHYTALKVAAAQATDVTFQLPAADAAGFWTSDGAGVLSLVGTPSDISGSTSPTGFSSVATETFTQLVVGKMVFIQFTVSGTSNATTFTVTGLPTSAVSTQAFCILITNAGVNAFGLVTIAGTTMTFYNNGGTSNTTWTATGTKAAYGSFWYQAS